jgi:hypothetical protein
MRIGFANCLWLPARQFFRLPVDRRAGDQVVFMGRVPEHEASLLLFDLSRAGLRRLSGGEKSFERLRSTAVIAQHRPGCCP